VRTLPAAGIVAIVSSPSGRGALGLVPFSTALPAKVIALGDAPAPSTLSISDGRYPLAVSLTAQSDFRFPSRYASALIAFTHSADANDLFVRTAYVTKGGL
jgi:hypothetical protein